MELPWKIVGQLGKLHRLYEDGKWAAKKKSANPVRGLALYHFQLSPYCARVRKAIAELGLDIPFREVLLDSSAYAELLQGGGKDLLPCLRISDSSGVRWMYESEEIIRYLSELSGQKRSHGDRRTSESPPSSS